MTINIVIADEHTIIRRGVLSMINGMSAANQSMDDYEFNVVGETNSPMGVLTFLTQNKVDILFLGYSLATHKSDNPISNLDGRGLIQWLASKYPDTKIVALSPYKNPNIIRKVLEAGAKGYISRDTCERTLWRTMTAVMNGEVYIERGLIDSLFRRDALEATQLSLREVDVLRMLCRGLSLNTISDKMGLSNKTISAHKLRAMEKLGVQSDCQLYCLLSNTGMFDIAI